MCNKQTKLNLAIVLIAMALCMAGVACAAPIGTVFTYQGRLADANSPAEGEYDFEFKLFDQEGGSNQFGNTVTKDEVDVIDGYFTVQLDFVNDANVFDGDARWLQIGVREGQFEDPNTYSAFSPRQEITPAPYAMHSENADKLDSFDSSAFASSGHDHDSDYALISHIHDDRYYTETQLQTSGSSNVHWDNLTSVPAGFNFTGNVTSSDNIYWWFGTDDDVYWRYDAGNDEFYLGYDDMGGVSPAFIVAAPGHFALTEGNFILSNDFLPSDDDNSDIGSGASQFKDLYIDGTANIDSLVADTADINAGTVDAITSLTVANNVDIGDYTITANGLTVDGTITDGTASLSSGVLSGTSYLLTNSRSVKKSENLQTQYDWLKSSDRDAAMGDATATNRRVLMLEPGNHMITSTLTLDEDYVDIVGLTNNPVDTYVQYDADAVVIQSADDVRMSNFTIYNNATDSALEITASDNSSSVYRYMQFFADGSANYSVHSTGILDGSWYHCTASHSAWVAATYLSAYMWHCSTEENDSFQTPGGEYGLSGTFIHCSAGSESFGGCEGSQSNAWGTFIDCTAGRNSYAMGMEFSGIAIRCKGGYNCFAGYNGIGTSYGTFSGYAKDCVVEGGNSFGTGHTSCTLSGVMIDCTIGDEGTSAGGVLRGSSIASVTDNSVKSSLTTALAGDNNDLVFTAKDEGTWGDGLTIEYSVSTVTFPPLGTIYVSNYKLRCVVGINGTPSYTATQVKDAFDGDAEAAALITIANADGDDGSGVVTAMAATNLSGGVNKPYFSNNHPKAPSACTTNTTVRAFDNGHTYNNTGAAAAITFTLPDAMAGLEYTFIRTEVAATKGVLIDPQDGDHIERPDGIPMANGEIYKNEADDYGLVKLKAINSTTWQVNEEVGVWVEDSSPGERNIFQGVVHTAMTALDGTDEEMEFDVVTHKDTTYYTHDTGANPENITIGVTGTYRISYTICWDMDLADMTTSRVWVEDDDAAIDNSFSYSYARHSGYGNMVSNTATFIADITAVSVIQLVTDAAKSSGPFDNGDCDSDTIADQAWILIEKIN